MASGCCWIGAIISCPKLGPRNNLVDFASTASRRRRVELGSYAKTEKPRFVVRAAMVDSYGNSSNFIQRMERTWLISQQPRPVACSSCNSNGHVDCKWCNGTGFFIIGDNMLCQVPSRNTSCVICAGKGSMRCSDCKGTGYRAKWLGEPPIPK